jgi:hypothetical protein
MHPPSAFISLVVAGCINCILIVVIVDVKVDRISADNVPILLMKFPDLPEVLEFVQPKLVIELIPECSGCKLWIWKFG